MNKREGGDPRKAPLSPSIERCHEGQGAVPPSISPGMVPDRMAQPLPPRKEEGFWWRHSGLEARAGLPEPVPTPMVIRSRVTDRVPRFATTIGSGPGWVSRWRASVSDRLRGRALMVSPCKGGGKEEPGEESFLDRVPTRALSHRETNVTLFCSGTEYGHCSRSS